MADVVVTATDLDNVRTVKQVEQQIGIAGAAIPAAALCRYDEGGRWQLASAAAENTAGVTGMAWMGVGVGEALTLIKQGIMDLGDALSLVPIGTRMYLSDTPGLLADTAGTVEVRIGRVIAGHAYDRGPGQHLLELTIT